MDPEGGDVLREVVHQDRISDEEMLAKAGEYLRRMAKALTEMGFSEPYCPGGSSGSAMFVYGRKTCDRFPKEDYASEIRVYVPDKAGIVTTITCYILDYVRMFCPRLPTQMDEVMAAHTKYATTFSLDICKAMKEENFVQFIEYIKAVKEARTDVCNVHYYGGLRFIPEVFGCGDNTIFHNS